jgi:hypothetical protein
MRIRGFVITAAICTTTVFGSAATADAKPHEKKVKTCKQNGNKLRCELTDGTTETGMCPKDYEPVQTIEVAPELQSANLNGNLFLCYSPTLGVVDDTPLG